MFKSSQRLVVDEIAPQSPLDRWNLSQPEGLQVKYGDRLERLNGIRVQSSPAEVSRLFVASGHTLHSFGNIWGQTFC